MNPEAAHIKKTATAPKTAAAPKPKEKKKKGCGCFTFIILLIILAGAGFYGVREYPLLVEKWTGFKLPSFLAKTPSEDSTQMSPPSKTSPTLSTAPTISTVSTTSTTNNTRQTTPSLSPQENTHQTKALSELNRKLTNISRQLDTLKQSPASSAVTSNTLLEFRLIDLALRLDGDTLAATKDLRQLADRENNPTLKEHFLNEVYRIETIPTRSFLLQKIRQLKNPTSAPSEESETEKSSSFLHPLIDILNIRPVSQLSDRSLFGSQLEELEWTILRGDRDKYVNLIRYLIEKEKWSPKQLSQLETLSKLGFPDYRLHFPPNIR